MYEGNDYVVLSDIMGDEDHLGDMDFKVAERGRCHRFANGYKNRWHNLEIMEVALAQARDVFISLMR